MSSMRPPPLPPPKPPRNNSHPSSSTPPSVHGKGTPAPTILTRPMPRPPRGQRIGPSAGASSDPIEIDSDSDDSNATMTSISSTRGHYNGKNGATHTFPIFTPDVKPGNSKGVVKSLQQTAAKAVFKDLQTSLQGRESTAAYCCGGSLPVYSQPRAEFDSAKGPIASPPVVIRFDHGGDLVSKITFPLDLKNGAHGLNTLLKACGMDAGEEVPKQEGILAKDYFAIDWHPADYGIVDALAQALVPEANVNMEMIDEYHKRDHWGVRAELASLNVDSTSSGNTGKQIDTPTAATQFGTLIVCLPHAHEGGQLYIYHKDYNSAFSWSQSNNTASTINWAAFYGDHEYDFGPIISDHRITLTYKLHINKRIGGTLHRYPSINPTLFPLHNKLRTLFEQPGFLSEGGTIGYACQHLYSHTSRYTEPRMPYSLRGLDSTIFSVFSSLPSTFDIRATVRPLLSTEPWDEHLQWKEENTDNEWWDPAAEREGYSKIDRVGERFERIKTLNHFESPSEDPSFTINKRLRYQTFEGVIWLNDPHAHHAGWEIQLVHPSEVYGSEIACVYSHAVILVDVPSFLERLEEKDRDVVEVVGCKQEDEATFPDWHRGNRGKVDDGEEYVGKWTTAYE